MPASVHRASLCQPSASSGVRPSRMTHTKVRSDVVNLLPNARGPYGSSCEQRSVIATAIRKGCWVRQARRRASTNRSRQSERFSTLAAQARPLLRSPRTGPARRTKIGPRGFGKRRYQALLPPSDRYHTKPTPLLFLTACGFAVRGRAGNPTARYARNLPRTGVWGRRRTGPRQVDRDISALTSSFPPPCGLSFLLTPAGAASSGSPSVPGFAHQSDTHARTRVHPAVGAR